jgi:tetratricopeptide (TPR) repeat protein
MKILQVAGILVLATAAVMGQGSNSRAPLHGEILSGPAIGALTVELSPNGGGPTQRTMVNGDGTFDMPAVDPGNYELRVVTEHGAILYSEIMSISNARQMLSIRLPETSNATRPSQGPVSISQLLHKPPAAAKKAFEKAEQADAKGNRQQAEELFRQAISIDPQFADAFNELGTIQAARGDFPQAIESFQKAIDAAPEHPTALANLSIVLAKSARYDEAAIVARHALRLMPGSGKIRYILASSLLIAKGESDEVLADLERSASEVPLAHLLAAQILAHRGKREEAAHQLEDYLRATPSNDKQRSRAEEMLAQLRS